MDYGLGHDEQQSLDVFSYAVLILVLLEYDLGHQRDYDHQQVPQVLILVLMEYGLGQTNGLVE